MENQEGNGVREPRLDQPEPIRKYLRNGQEVEVVDYVRGGWLVRNVEVVWSEDGQEDTESLGDVTYFVHKSEIFDRAPTEKIDQDLTRLIAERDRIQREVWELHQKELEGRNTRNGLQRYEPLASLLMVMDATVNSFYAVRMQDDVPTRSPECVTKESLKMLIKWYKGDPEVQWSLGYDDTRVLVTKERDQAVEAAKAAIEKRLSTPGLEHWRYENAIKGAAEYGVPIPKEHQQHARDAKLASIQQRRAGLEKQLAALDKEMEAASGT